MHEKLLLRARDFWTALALIAASLFFLGETARLPFFDATSGGVASGAWYNSAALTPFVIFGALLVLGLGLLAVAIRDGGARAALSGLRAAPRPSGGTLRGAAVAAMLLIYIFALVPRVDFILATALLLTALIYGFHEGRARPAALSLAAMAAAGAYALIAHFPQADWARLHDDDWVALGALALLTAGMLIETAAAHGGRLPGYARATPLIALIAPFLLVVAMAFGFQQNVPNRSGLLFSKIEYHYFVTLKPLWTPR